MRRILRKIASGDSENLGDTSTLLDPTVVEEIKTTKKDKISKILFTLNYSHSTTPLIINMYTGSRPKAGVSSTS